MEKEKGTDKYWITVSETINTGNFNSIKIEAGFTKSYEEGNASELIKKDYEELQEVISKKAKKIRKNLDK